MFWAPLFGIEYEEMFCVFGMSTEHNKVIFAVFKLNKGCIWSVQIMMQSDGLEHLFLTFAGNTYKGYWY